MFKRWHLLPVLAVLILVLILLPSQIASAADLCGTWDTLSVMGGEYIIMNNVWGATTTQCINIPSTNSNNFTVTRADHNQGSVASYPAAIKGCHWDLCTTNSGMPIRVSDIRTAPFSWSTNRLSSGAWNTSPEAWFSPITDATNGYNGGAELMIWLDYMGTQPAGSQVGTATIAGASWEVWYANIGWNYIAYRRSGLTSISADLKPFITDAVSRGYIQNSWYLHVLEAGIELTRGGTGFVSNAFTFNVNGGPQPTSVPPTNVPPTNIPPTSNPNNTVSINAGGSATGSFTADQYFSGGSTYTNTRTINMSQIPTNPPPTAVFSTERYGAMTYTIPNRSGVQTVTLYFAETYVTAAGQRVFNVTINGSTVLSNFDIFASAGGADRAIVRSFSTTANSSGQVVIQFTAVTQSPKINGITVAAGGPQPTTIPPTGVPPTGVPPTGVPPTGVPPTAVPPTSVPPTSGPGACSPVTSTITVPFTQDGAGTFCWQTSRLGSYINSWNLSSLTINGVDFTNRWANSFPPAINGSWYISYRGSFAWSHFEAK